MKKIIFFVVAIIGVFTSCNNSPESKANALIKKDLIKELYDPDSYKPVETTVDSAFSPYDDPVLFEKVLDFVDIGNEIESNLSDQKHAKSSMSLWSDPYQTAYGNNRYNEAKSDYNKATKDLEKAIVKVQKIIQEISEMLNKETKFIGWKATHNYRADDGEGKTIIGNTIYIIDENYEKILFSYEKDEYELFQEAIDELKERIEDNGQPFKNQ